MNTIQPFRAGTVKVVLVNQEKSTPAESDREPLDLDDLSVDPEETRIVHRGRVVVAEDEALIRLDVVEKIGRAHV